MSANGFRGRRLEARRDGITPMTFMRTARCYPTASPGRGIERIESSRLRKLLAATVLSFAAGASARAPLPPARAAEILSLKNRGLAQLEEGKNREAQASFAKLASLVPSEPLPYADGAIAALRAGDSASAERLLARAETIAPSRAEIDAISAAIAQAADDHARARTMLAKAAALSPLDLESRWRWVRSADADPGAKADLAGSARYLQEIVRQSPANVPAWTKLLLVRLEAGDAAGAREAAAALEKILSPMEPRVARYFAEGRDLLAAGTLKEAGLKFRIAENLLRVTDRYRQSLSELYTDVSGLPLETFSPAFEESLRPRAGAPIAISFVEKRDGVREMDPDLLRRRVDLGNNGARETYAIPAPFRAALFSDVDLDGDLDVYLFGSGGPDRLLRNNLDGTWTDITGETGDPGFSSARAVAADVDRDGDPDLVCVNDRGAVIVRSNLRQGRFQSISLPVDRAVDVAVGDVNADGLPDIVVAAKNGLVLLVNRGGGRFERAPGGDLARLPAGFVPRRIALADLDNDGFLDVIVGGESGLVAYRNAGLDTFTWWPVAPRVGGRVDAIAAIDADGDGGLDLAISEGGRPRLFLNAGGNANNWLDVALEGLAASSGKVNREGIGSLVEIKAGNLYSAQAVSVLPTHFGLGKRARADVVRCVWTNGVPQNLFDQKARATVREVQQLKGSCPFVYALDGRSGKWSFVSDALGRAPIGLLYDGVHLAGADPREWLKIDGSVLSPNADGRLVLDYTEELWEAAFVDMTRLMAVDHPAGTDIVPNERTIPGILEKKLFTVAKPSPVRAADEDGEDVTALLAKADHRYVTPGRETAYQGVRTEHALTLDLGPVPERARVMLYLNGWIFYTDTSINVSLSQRHDLHPFPPVLEVPDGKGGWRVAMESFGFPAGKTKTMPVDLTGLLAPGDARVRIRTTMAIYWDQAYVTVDDPAVETRVTELAPESAVLSRRGFSRRYRETPDGPELFDHDSVESFPRWADVPGRVTRYGDVTPLLQSADDRWVAFVGGDAMRIAFDAKTLPAVPQGWTRDWILVSDGWDKDFDKNTAAGTAVGPYPFHAMSRYPYPEDEKFPDSDFLAHWLTRRVSSEDFDAFVRELGEPAIR